MQKKEKKTEAGAGVGAGACGAARSCKVLVRMQTMEEGNGGDLFLQQDGAAVLSGRERQPCRGREWQGGCKATWHAAGSPNQHYDKVDSDQ